MKKLRHLLLFISFLFAGFAIEAQTTYTFSDYAAGTQYAIDEEHILDDDVTIYTTECHFTTQLRVYSSSTHNGYFYTAELPNNIQSLGFNMGNKKDNVAIYGSNDGATWDEVGTIAVTSTSYNDYSIDFGSNNYKRFKFDVVGTQQVRIKTMTITYKADVNAVAAPTFSPEEGSYISAQSVSISCDTEGATIYYTTDGSDPTTSSSVYSSPIEVASTTTIKAIAVKEGLSDSAIAEAEYNILQVSTIAEARSVDVNEMAAVEGIVTFIDGRNIYVQDETAGIDLYLNSNTVPETLAIGDKVRAYGKKTVYNGLVELTGINGNDNEKFYIISKNNELPLAEKTIAEIFEDFNGSNLLQSTRVMISDATIGNINNNGNTPIHQESNSINIYKLPYVEGLIPTDMVSVIGIIGCYNSPQLRVVSADDVTFSHVPAITVDPSSLSGLNYYINDGPSESMSFKFSGSNLKGNLYIHSSESFEVSGSGGANFFSEDVISVSSSSGNFSNVSAHVRLRAGLEIGEYNEQIMLTSKDADTVFVSVSGTVMEEGTIEPNNDYVRISDINELTVGGKVVFAARHDDNETSYYAMPNVTSGKPNGVLFNIADGGLLPSEIVDEIDSYCWTIGKDGDHFTFTNASGDMIGWSSSTNFTTGGNNIIWTVSKETSDAEAMVSSYEGFVITNTNTESANTIRAFALNSSAKFGAYAKSNMSGDNAATYNFMLDMFVNAEVGTPVVATPIITPESGTYYEAQTISITCNTEDAIIYYTTDGNEPDNNSDVYTEPFVIENSTIVKAIAYKEGFDASNVATAEYNIQLGIAAIFSQDWEGDMNGWSFVSLEGTNWTINSYSGNHYAYVNGYNQGTSTAWCISPAFNLNSYENVVLSFTSAKNYNGPDMEVFFSNDYDGSNPASATWTSLNCTLSSGSWAWVESGDISMEEFAGENCYIGFKYTCTESEAAGWEVDDILLVGSTSSPVLTASPSSLNGFSYYINEGPSAEQYFTLSGMNLTADINVSASASYEISLTSGTDFTAQESITLAPANGNIENSIYVRLKSGLEVGTYSEQITITSTEAEDIVIICNGSVNEQGEDWVRISSLSDITEGSRIIIASRHDATLPNSYYVMKALTSGKPEGVLAISSASGNNEVMPAEIVSDIESYYWNIGIVDGSYILTNAAGDTLGYGGSGTNFVTGNQNANWVIAEATSGDAAMIPSYSAFSIINTNYERGIAQNTSHKFGPYSTTNINTADYNFYQDIFMEGGNSGIPTVSTPTFSHASGTYYEAINVEISCATPDAIIYYTTDGSEPDNNSSIYTEAIMVENDMNIKAIAYKEGMNDSNIASASYVINTELNIVFNQDWENDWNGWSQMAVAGVTEWSIASYGNNHYAYVNGYNNGASEAWLISPSFNLNEYAGRDVVLTFTSAKNYNGPDVEVLFSNDFDNDPSAATWTPLTCVLSEGSWNWVESGDILLNEFNGENCHIAFKYTCSDTESAAWEIDDIMLACGNSDIPNLNATPNSLNGFSCHVDQDGPSDALSYILSGSNLIDPETQEDNGNIDITVSSNIFEISLDDIEYSDNLAVTFTEGNVETEIFVRMKAVAEVGEYTATIINEGGSANVEVSLSGSIIDTYTPVIKSEMLPIYIQGNDGSNNERIPYAFIVEFAYLKANSTYRYINQAVTTDDGETASGAGNIIFVNGDNFFRTTSSSLETDDSYGEFTTDENGEYKGWFILEATANARFTPGNHVYMRIRLNDGNNGTSVEHYLTTESYATVIGFGTENETTQGTAIWGKSNNDAKDFVFLYDNENAEGRPLYATSIETTGIDYTNISQYASFYKDNVAGIDGNWGGIIPNSNENGVKAITVIDNTTFEVTSTYEYVETWAVTTNPNGGTDAPIFIDLTGTSVTEINMLNVNIWSTRYEFLVENNSNSTLQMTTFNTLGQVVFDTTVGAGVESISHNLSKGIYIVRLSNNKDVKTVKLIVK